MTIQSATSSTISHAAQPSAEGPGPAATANRPRPAYIEDQAGQLSPVPATKKATPTLPNDVKTALDEAISAFHGSRSADEADTRLEIAISKLITRNPNEQDFKLAWTRFEDLYGQVVQDYLDGLRDNEQYSPEVAHDKQFVFHGVADCILSPIAARSILNGGNPRDVMSWILTSEKDLGYPPSIRLRNVLHALRKRGAPDKTIRELVDFYQQRIGRKLTAEEFQHITGIKSHTGVKSYISNPLKNSSSA